MDDLAPILDIVFQCLPQDGDTRDPLFVAEMFSTMSVEDWHPGGDMRRLERSGVVELPELGSAVAVVAIYASIELRSVPIAPTKASRSSAFAV